MGGVKGGTGRFVLPISGYSADGAGVARPEDGPVIFVPGALDGELCEIEVTRPGNRYTYGTLLRVIEASPERREPDCPLYGTCGGCGLRHMSYEEELRMKQQRVRDALQRIAGLELPVTAIHGAKKVDFYRNKVQFPVAPGPEGKPLIGFYQARSHTVVAVDHCRLQHRTGEGAAEAVWRWMTSVHVPAYREQDGTGFVRHLCVRVNSRGDALICIVTKEGVLPSLEMLLRLLRRYCPNMVGLVHNINQAKTNVILGPHTRHIWGDDHLMDTLCGLQFKISMPTFYQVNHDQAEVLYGIAKEYADLSGQELLVDLYCGAGTIGLTMADQARGVIGVERVPHAVADARENAARNGIENAAFFCMDAGLAAKRMLMQELQPDVILVDPPRKGLDPMVVESAVQMDPERIVYVSCDPGTLARDLRRFEDLGYMPRKIEAVDLFPRTPHVESVCLLERGAHLGVLS